MDWEEESYPQWCFYARELANIASVLWTIPTRRISE